MGGFFFSKFFFLIKSWGGKTIFKRGGGGAYFSGGFSLQPSKLGGRAFPQKIFCYGDIYFFGDLKAKAGHKGGFLFFGSIKKKQMGGGFEKTNLFPFCLVGALLFSFFFFWKKIQTFLWEKAFFFFQDGKGTQKCPQISKKNFKPLKKETLMRGAKKFILKRFGTFFFCLFGKFCLWGI